MTLPPVILLGLAEKLAMVLSAVAFGTLFLWLFRREAKLADALRTSLLTATAALADATRELADAMRDLADAKEQLTRVTELLRESAAVLARDRVDALVEAWHARPNDGTPLHVFLGWSEGEYRRWVETNEIPARASEALLADARGAAEPEGVAP